MKTKFLTLTLLVVSSVLFAQDKESLKVATQKMIDKYISGDPKAIASTMYPKIFSVVSKTEMLANIKNNIKGSDYTSGLINTDPSIDYGAIVKTEDGYFCIVTYNTHTKIALKEKPAPNKVEETKERFKKLLKFEKISYHPENGVLDAKKRIQTVAIMDSGTNKQWTFVPLDSDYAQKVLPGYIKKAIAQQ